MTVVDVFSAAAVAQRYRMRLANLGGADPAALAMLPSHVAQRHGAFPVRVDGGMLTVAVADPTNALMLHEIADLSGRSVALEIAAPDDIAAAIATAYTRACLRRPRTPGAPAANRPTRILVAEDNGATRMIVCALLKASRFVVTEVRDGAEALAALAAGEPPDLAIVDLDMPNVDGHELFRQLRIEGVAPELPVIILTASSDDELENALLAGGVDDFVSKPIEPKAFLARVQAVLRRVAA